MTTKKRTSGAPTPGTRVITLDGSVYDRRAVVAAAREFGEVCRVRVRPGEGPITLEFGGGDADELDFRNLALQRTIEEIRG